MSVALSSKPNWINTMDKSVLDRFWKKVNKAAPDGCWEWTAQTSELGYGRLKVNSNPCYAHRVSWEIHNGDIPNGLCVLHSCDNPPCCNPSHLFLGTHADNAADRTLKGRTCRRSRNRGEKNGSSILTEILVREIRLNKEKKTQVQLTRIYNVSRSTINNILNRKSWV